MQSNTREAVPPNSGVIRSKPASKRRISKEWLYRGISVGSLLAALLLWWSASTLEWVNPLFLPKPQTVWSAFVDVLQDGYKGQTLLNHIGTSMRRLFLALAAAFITAVPLGILCGRYRVLRAVVDPFIEFYRPLPPLAYYTLLILWFGITDVSKVLLLFLGAFAPLFITAVFSVQRLSADRINGARSLGARGWKLYVFVIFPSVLPELLTGLRTAVGVSYSTLVAAEMVAAVSGIGWLVLDASKFLRSDIMYLGIIIMALIAIAIDLIIRSLIRRVSPWTEQ
ncbi:ABC transporter permease subunit [Paenibacillus pedocola]|uniref:ABC transporter permease subunit n=1 Tax=Paenibacillus pedocola TaxID=3242193 RepID=UPI0028774225|nr:ABC transporter permease subunit [Paenibacillus typhae]